MPNLPGRYEHSLAKGEEVRPVAVAAFEPQERVPCLGGCGLEVPVGQKCPDCAAAAVDAWLERREHSTAAERVLANPNSSRKAQAIAERVVEREQGALL